MTIQPVSRAEFAATTHTTLANVDAAIRQDQRLAVRKQQDVSSALKTLARAIDAPITTVPAYPGAWRKPLTHFAPAKIGISPERWRNVLSLCRFALDHTGLGISGRNDEPLMPAWSDAMGLLTEKRLRLGLISMVRFCSRQGVAPDEVNDDVASAFLKYLEEVLVRKKPRSIHRTACQCWNRAANTFEGWSKRLLVVPNYRNDYVVPWSEFPESLPNDVECYLIHLARPSLLIPKRFRPLKPSSICTRRRQIHEFVSALTRRGHKAADLKSLADVVAVERVLDGLEFYLDPQRPNGPARKQASDMAYVIVAAARHWVRVEENHLEQLTAISKNIAVKRGMTEKNRTRLRPFNDPEKLHALLNLPQRLVAKADRSRLSPFKRALLVETAVLIELSIMAAMRRENLRSMEISRTLLRTSRGGFHIAVPDEDTKTDVGVEVPLGSSTARLLNLFIEQHRPILLKERHSNWLFVGANGGPKGAETLGRQISACIKRECGLDMNPHLFRHLLAKIILDRHPGAYGLVRSAIGHKDIKTTTTYYAGMERAAAIQHYDAEVLKLRDPETACEPPAKNSRRRK